MYLKLAVFYNNWKSIDPDCWNNMKNKKYHTQLTECCGLSSS